jgi:D-sedoheptulose 7-phosphate isomerase
VADDAALRAKVARQGADAIAEATAAIAARLRRGGKLLIFGNGGSATDANDWAIDCVAPPRGLHPVPALSLAMEPATISAIANDVGSEVIFLRQLIAHAEPGDVAVAISTSGGSLNLIAALAEARKRRLLTVALLGYDGGEIRRQSLADHCIVIDSDYIPRIQEVHASIYHLVRECLGDHEAA